MGIRETTCLPLLPVPDQLQIPFPSLSHSVVQKLIPTHTVRYGTGREWEGNGMRDANAEIQSSMSATDTGNAFYLEKSATALKFVTIKVQFQIVSSKKNFFK